MHVDFGCNLREFLFEPKTPRLQDAIASRVKSQLAKWMPFLQLATLFILFSEDDPSIPEYGFKVQMKVVYGNIPLDIFLSFPVT
jgi:hypothetical protein